MHAWPTSPSWASLSSPIPSLTADRAPLAGSSAASPAPPPHRRAQSCPGKGWIDLSLSDFTHFPQPSRLTQRVQIINEITRSSHKPAVHLHCRYWGFQESIPWGSLVLTIPGHAAFHSKPSYRTRIHRSHLHYKWMLRMLKRICWEKDTGTKWGKNCNNTCRFTQCSEVQHGSGLWSRERL